MKFSPYQREKSGVTAAPDTESPSSSSVPRQCTLDGFAIEVGLRDGLDVRQVDTLTTILVRTHNSVYRIIPLSPGDTRVLIQGGQFFPEPTEGRLAGSGFGGSFIKLAWIGVGLHMEVNAGGERIITSAVVRIKVERDSPAMPSRH